MLGHEYYGSRVLHVSGLSRVLDFTDTAHGRRWSAECADGIVPITPKQRQRVINESLKMVIDVLVDEKEWYKSGEWGNWWWFARAVAEETDYEVQSFFAFTQQTWTLCHAPEAHTPVAHPLLSICDLETHRYKDCSTVGDGIDMFADHVDVVKCRSSNLGLEKCNADAVCSTSCLRPPHILFVSLPEQPAKAEQCWTCDKELLVCGVKYRLAGRVVSTSEAGSHFRALTFYPVPLGPYVQAGIYAFDDMTGPATLLRGNTDEAFEAELAKVPLSNLAVFVALTAIGDPLPSQTPTTKITPSQAKHRHQLQLSGASVLGLQRFTLIRG
ncbi:hypothetical protein V8E36_001302 [Tilletia maclaganii]